VSVARSGLFSVLLLSASVFAAPVFSAETISGALAKAYENNSELNSARAGVRVTDEGVAIAKSGWRPVVGATASINYTSQTGSRLTTGSFGVAIEQTLFDGFRTKNNVAASKARVLASNESLRNTEQNILFNAAAAYMDVIRDRAIAALRAQNLAFLEEQVRAARSRFEVGEGTRTDVAQAEAQRAAAVAQLAAARAQAKSSEAVYHQVVGTEPGSLRGAGPLAKLLPKSMEAALTVGAIEHPAIRATEHLVDVAAFTVKSAEGALLPSLTAQAGVSHGFTDRSPPSFLSPGGQSNSASIGATLSIPLYQGGRVAAQIRQSKESLGQARIDVDVSRDQVRAAVVSAWSQYYAAAEGVAANREVVEAARLALNGVVEERNVGQRTTLDVLNAQADVIAAQINLVSSERDVVVASYAILSAMGRLSVHTLGLNVAVYDPKEHYEAVKDKWFGLRTPDGR